MMKKVLRVLITAFSLVTLSVAASSHAEPESSREYLVKAAFIYNFVKFVEWPEKAFRDSSSPINLCVLGDDPFEGALDTIVNKTVSGRELVVTRRLKAEGGLRGCHIVYVSESEKNRLWQIVEQARDMNILTVSDMESFARRGGVIGFVTRENKIRFEINVDAAQKSELRISSKLLKLSTIVRGDGHRKENGN